MPVITRRNLMIGGGMLAAFAGGMGLPGAIRETFAAKPRLLKAHRTSASIDGKAITEDVLTWSSGLEGEGPEPPVIRTKVGQPFAARLINELDEPTTIHWHGLRINNAMDGVPFLTQPYVYPGDTFDYAFIPPDAGTHWYHPHCNTLTQIGHGMAGLIIIENPDDPVFDQEVALNLRDWRLGGNSQFIAQFKPRDAARSGTYGTVKTASWKVAPQYDVPSGGLTRVRIAISDVTRIYRFVVEGGAAMVLAIDGNPLAAPFPLEALELGPGQRLDIALLMPETEGAVVSLRDTRPSKDYEIASFRAVGASLKRQIGDIKPLPANSIAEPDLSNAEVLPVELSATAEDAPVRESFCGSIGYNFWAINKVPWSGDTADPHDPLYEMKQGKSYIIEMANRTPHAHPIHLHGLNFKVLQSTAGPVMPIYTDTYLIRPDETVRLGLVADNPGDWAFHCHIIEHQKTGMTSFLRVA